MATGFPNVTTPIPGNPGLPPVGTIKSYGDFSSSTGVTMRDLQGRFAKGGVGFQVTGLQGVVDLPKNFSKSMKKDIEKNMRALQKEIEAYAKANAPWNDRSGDARRGLKTASSFSDTRAIYEITLGHTVYYGNFLEGYNGGAYAIILPTLQYFAPRLQGVVK